MVIQKTLKFVFLLGLVAFFFAATETAEAKKKELWEKLPASSFPAYVKSIILQDKTELKPGDSFKVGSWTITLPNEPVARVTPPSGGHRGIIIQGFTCGNLIDGEVSCEMLFNDQIGTLAFVPNSCYMIFKSKLSNVKDLFIDCPRDLILDIN